MLINKILKKHINFLNIIKRRQNNISKLIKYWEKKDFQSLINNLQF